MSHSARTARDSDDDSEIKTATGRMQTRMLTVQSMSSPLRRSSRIKQNKYLPGSESDSSSVSISRTTRSTRARTGTMDSTVSDTTKRHARKSSISSDISEVDVDMPQTPRKRMTRQSSSVVNTPTRMSTRAISKRLVRAVSESPIPETTTMRRTRASSVDPESLSDQNKSRFNSPVKTRKRVSMLPSSSLAKEQIELQDRIPYVRLDATIVEADEITSSEKVESTDSSKDESLKNTENILVEEQHSLLEKTPSSDDSEIYIISPSSSSCRNSMKEDKTKIVITESLLDVEKPLIDTCESIKVENVFENSLDSSDEQKNYKENEIPNINSDISVEKSMCPNTTSSSIKSPVLSFMNKSLNENETKSMKKDLGNRRHSRESIEIATKHDDLSKEVADNSQKNISTEFLNTTASNKTAISQHNDTKLADKIINEDETSIGNISTSTDEDATKVTNLTNNESDKIEKQCSIDNQNSNKIEFDKIDNTSCLPVNLTKSIQLENRNDDRESPISILTTNDTEIKLILEEQSSRQDENKVLLNVLHSKSCQLIDLQISSPINESSDDRATILQSSFLQNSTEEKPEQENLSKSVAGSTLESSNTTVETNNSTCDGSNNTVSQDNQSSEIIESSKISTMDISPEKVDAEKIVKWNLKRKSTGVLGDLEKEKRNSQMETSKKDENKEIDDDISKGIDLFKDIPSDKWKEKNDVKTDSVQLTSKIMEEGENDNETECDLILVDKQSWLAAEKIKAAKEAESFEYDSDDTVLLKSRLDAKRYNAKELDIVNEEIPMDIDSEENKKQIKKRKSRTQRRLTSEIDQNSSEYTENEDNLVSVDKSLNESNTKSISRLNKSQQSAGTKGRSSKISIESGEGIEEDENKLNRSSLISKKNTSLRKSLKDTSMQSVSANKSQMDDSKEKLYSSACTEKKLNKKKCSLNNSSNEDTNDATKSKKENVSIGNSSKTDENKSLHRFINPKSKIVDIKTMIDLNDDESDDESDVSVTAMDFGSKTYSMIANMGSDNCDQDEYDIPSYLFAKANSDNNTDDNSSDSDTNTDDSSSDSDIKREYNLDGVEPKFSDDDVLADECRISEVEVSDSDDNGSDLADFIVNDDEDEKEDDEDEEENDEDMQDMKENDSENESNAEDVEAAHEEEDEEEVEQAHIDSELIDSVFIDTKNEKDDMDIEEKDYTANKEDAKENKLIEIEASSSHVNTSDKFNMYNEKTILLDSSNSDLSIKKKKSLTKENNTSLSDASDLISLSVEKEKKLDSQFSSGGDSSEELNKYEFLSSKKLSKSYELMKFSTPNHNSKKSELDEIFERVSKDVEPDNTVEATQNISIKKKKSKKDRTLNENINLEKSIYANKETISNNDFSPDLLKLLEKTNLPKVISSKKVKLRKTMNINIGTPTLKHLRKEKLNESAPILKSNKETNSSSTTKLSMENDTEEIGIKDNNKNEASDLVALSSDNIVRSQKKQKKRKRHDTSKENADILSEGIELDVPKKKKRIKLTQLNIVDNNSEDVCQIIKKKKKQNPLKENITLSEDAIELKISKKKKLVKHTQSTIIDDNVREDASSNKKKKKKKKQDTLKENIVDKVLSKNGVQSKILRKKKPVNLTQSTIIDYNIRADASISEEKKKKKKKRDTLKENIINEALSKEIELKIPKNKKRENKLIQLSNVEGNSREDICKINEKKKKKKQETLKENTTEKALFEDVIELTVSTKEEQPEKRKKKGKKENVTEKILSKYTTELKYAKKKKYPTLNQAAIQNNRKDVYQINEKEKKKKKQINIVEEDENMNEDNTLEKYISKNKKELIQKKKDKIANNLDSSLETDKHITKNKTKRQETIESTDILQTKKKKNTLPVQIPVWKLKSDKNLLAHKLQKTALAANKSKNTTKEPKDGVTAKTCISKKLKSKKRHDQIEDIENAIHVNVPNKKSKEVKEATKPSSSGLKRLSDEVIESLMDTPTRMKKRRKISQNKDQLSSVRTSKSKVATADLNEFTSSTSGCTTQFQVINLQKAKKQPSKTAAAAASFRKRMLARNKRESISAYIIYRDKMNLIN